VRQRGTHPHWAPGIAPHAVVAVRRYVPGGAGRTAWRTWLGPPAVRATGPPAAAGATACVARPVLEQPEPTAG